MGLRISQTACEAWAGLRSPRAHAREGCEPAGQPRTHPVRPKADKMSAGKSHGGGPGTLSPGHARVYIPRRAQENTMYYR
jgi:hypothetical protein